MRKELTPGRIHEVLKKLALIFHFTDLSVANMAEAAEMKWNDYEDAVQSATAKRVHADCIITGNIRDYLQSSVPAYTPAEFLRIDRACSPGTGHSLQHENNRKDGRS